LSARLTALLFLNYTSNVDPPFFFPAGAAPPRPSRAREPPPFFPPPPAKSQLALTLPLLSRSFTPAPVPPPAWIETSLSPPRGRSREALPPPFQRHLNTVLPAGSSFPFLSLSPEWWLPLPSRKLRSPSAQNRVGPPPFPFTVSQLRAPPRGHTLRAPSSLFFPRRCGISRPYDSLSLPSKKHPLPFRSVVVLFFPERTLPFLPLAH